MSGTFPTSVGFRSVVINSERSNFRSQSMSGRTTVRNVGGQRWAINVTLPAMKRATFAPVAAFIEQQKSGSESFQIKIPVYGDQSGNASGSILTSTTGSAGDTSIAIDGISGTLKAGDFFKFANHNKVYMITSDLTGAGTLNFQPELAASVANNEALTYTEVPFTVRLASDVQTYDVGVDSLASYEFDLVEVI